MFQPIPGWERSYEVNECGEVRNKKSGRLLTGDINHNGYPRVLLQDKDNPIKKQRFLRHRLVATLFVPNPLGLPEVDHKDRNTHNCHYTNLQWVTREQNEQHCYMSGSKPYHPFMAEFEDGIHTYDHKNELAEEINVSVSTVKNWLTHSHNGYEKYGINSIQYIN